MSTESKNSDGQAADVAAFGATESEAARKAIRSQLIVLAVVSLILIVYFAVLNKYIKQWTEPKELATFSVRLMDDNVPSMTQMLEGALTDAAPQLANFITNKAVKDGVPYLVKHTEKYLNDYTDAMSKETGKVMEEGFKSALVENKPQILAMLQNNQNKDDPEIAVRPMRDALRDSFVKQTTNRKTEAGKAVEGSLRMLKNMSRRIKVLAGKDPKDLTRREQVAARLLRMHWQWMRQRTAGDIDAEKEMNDTAVPELR